jgi:hypothetical protein
MTTFDPKEKLDPNTNEGQPVDSGALRANLPK